MNILQRLLIPLTLLLTATGCAATLEEPAMADDGSCTVVSDAYGEREVCTTYTTFNGVQYYYDPYFNIWVGGGGYWYGNRYYNGYFPGWGARYGGFYHSRGFYSGRGYHGGYHNYSHGGGHFGGGGHGHR
jgi:hypothetical protein